MSDSNYWHSFTRTAISRRRTVKGAAAAAGLALVAAGCGGSSSGKTGSSPAGLTVPIADETKSAQRGGTIAQIMADSQPFDPVLTPSIPLYRFYGELLRLKGGLLEPAKGELEGDVAEAWEYSPDKLQLTFKLSPKAHFAPLPPQNGRAVEADDVLFSYNHLNDLGLRRGDLSNAVSPSAPVQSLTAPDSRTIVVKFVEPVSTALYLFATSGAATLPIMPKEGADPNLFDLRNKINGTGPWMLQEYVPSSRYTLRRNPAFGQDSRPNLPFIDEVFAPILTEYAAGLAQFKSGALHLFNVRAEDILSTKRDVPALELRATDVSTNVIRNFFGYLPESPFKDERVRQAWSLTWDRDLFIDAQFNVAKFKAEGLPMETRWSTTLQADVWTGYWLDPQSKDFGPNAKYYVRDIAEAKKLLAAAGLANGLDVDNRFPFGGHPYGPDYNKHIEIIQGMTVDAGFRNKNVDVGFNNEWRTVYQSGNGKFSGTSYVNETSNGVDPAVYLYRYYNTRGAIFRGFDAQGLGNAAGDIYLDDLTTKIRREFDDKKRQELIKDLQRYEGKSLYYIWLPGGANSFSLAWPAVRNLQVWRGSAGGYNPEPRRDLATLWLDRSKPPFKQA
jgi:peptide/nickel transport system substrate-binding protein